MTPSAQHITTGSEHGTFYRGFAASRYQASATPLACRIEDRHLAHPPVVVRIERRAWLNPNEPACWSSRIDDDGRKFW
jgi:hypothetical protein